MVASIVFSAIIGIAIYLDGELSFWWACFLVLRRSFVLFATLIAAVVIVCFCDILLVGALSGAAIGLSAATVDVLIRHKTHRWK